MIIVQTPRWYPSAVVLSNGSVVVVGGETGANAPPNPTLEILPRIPGGPTLVFLDWLNRTDPNNLYPYLQFFLAVNSLPVRRTMRDFLL
jgi:hypothetical protein